MIIARKVNKISEFHMIFARKKSRILRNNCPKNIFPNFWRARAAPTPVSYAYGFKYCEAKKNQATTLWSQLRKRERKFVDRFSNCVYWHIVR